VFAVAWLAATTVAASLVFRRNMRAARSPGRHARPDTQAVLASTE
jgi:hypothetical protein